jgi:hypothetical protein
MILKQKRLIWAVSITILFIVGVIITRAFILNEVKTRLEQQLETLRKSGLDIQYDSIIVDWKRNKLTIQNLSIWKKAVDSICQSDEFVTTKMITVKGFRVWPLIVKSQLSFKEISIDSLHGAIRNNFRLLANTGSEKKRKEFSIQADYLKFPGLEVEYMDSTSCSLLTKVTTTITISAFGLKFFEDRSPLFNLTTVHLQDATVIMPQEFYTFSIKESILNLNLGVFNVDTLKIIPHYSTLAFGRKRGYETDRFEGVIPYINLSGISLHYQDTVHLSAQKAELQFFLKVFRDKRLPFKDKVTLLPIQQLQALPFGLQLETLTLIKSYVEYEEFADKADSAGIVFFDNLYATLNTINNTSTSAQGKTLLSAQSNFMGQGLLSVTAVCPWKSTNDYSIRGSLKDFHIPRLNSILEPTARVSATSGLMKNFTFHFTYNSKRSTGEIELNYNDLKIVTFRNDETDSKKKKRKRSKNGYEPDELKKDGFKTFILNAFIIRKDMDKKVPEAKRTGTISFERDPSKSIFNYWWKSVFSGIKSAYNLDKIKERIDKLTPRKKVEKTKD